MWQNDPLLLRLEGKLVRTGDSYINFSIEKKIICWRWYWIFWSGGFFFPNNFPLRITLYPILNLGRDNKCQLAELNKSQTDEGNKARKKNPLLRKQTSWYLSKLFIASQACPLTTIASSSSTKRLSLSKKSITQRSLRYKSVQLAGMERMENWIPTYNLCFENSRDGMNDVMYDWQRAEAEE